MKDFFNLRPRIRHLCDGSFPGMTYSEKKDVLDSLEICCEGVDPNRGHAFHVGFLREQCDSGKEGCTGCREPEPACGTDRNAPAAPGTDVCSGNRLPECLGTKLLEIARTDPYPRVRRSAVRVLIRFGPSALTGAGPEDFLPGLLSRNEVSSCAVLHFLLNKFGPSSLRGIIEYLDRQDPPIRPMMLRLLEGFCEENLRGLDPCWGLMQLRKRFCGEKGAAKERDPWEAEVLVPVRCRDRFGQGPGVRGPGIPDRKKTLREASER
jgi:hypothetical protein